MACPAISCGIPVHRQSLNSLQLAAKSVEVPLEAPYMNSGCRLPAIEHQGALCHPMNSKLGHAQERGLQEHATLRNLSIRHHLQDIGAIHGGIFDFFAMHRQELIHLATFLSLAHQSAQLIPFSLCHVRSQHRIASLPRQRIPLLLIPPSTRRLIRR